jgi:hypothetical protein
MNPAIIIKNAEMDGVVLALSATGTIKATGDGAVVNRWLPMIRAHKESIIAVLKVGAGDMAPFDKEAFEERAAICEFDGGLSRDEAEAIAWHEDDRRRCRHCLNLLPNGICKVASPKGLVVANRGYRPVDIPRRCEGYRPCPDDPDRRTGMERWPGLVKKGGNDV